MADATNNSDNDTNVDNGVEMTDGAPPTTDIADVDRTELETLEVHSASRSSISRSNTITPSIRLQTLKHYRIDPKKWHGWFRGYVRQDWDTINVPDGVDELRAHWVELFFDLIYVACIIHISTEAAYSVSRDDSHRRLASTSTHPNDCEEQWKYSFIMVAFAQFGLLCNAWMAHVLYTTRYFFNQMMDDGLRLAFMMCVLAMGIFIKDTESYHRAFLISFQMLKVVEILMYAKVALIPRGKSPAAFSITMAVINIIIVFIIFGAMDGACAAHYFVVYVFLNILETSGIFIAMQVTKCLKLDKKNTISIPINVPHISERVGLFVMIILGESIISLMSSDLGELDLVEKLVFHADGSPPSQILIIFVLMTFVLAYSVARLYFDCQPSEESIMEGNDNHALRVSKTRGIIFMKAHRILFYGLLGLGMGIKITGKHFLLPDKAAIDVVLPGYSLVVIIITLNVIRIVHPYTVHIKFWIGRSILLIVMIVLPLFWRTLNHGVIFLVFCLCVELQLWLDVEGKEKKKKTKEELKERRELAKDHRPFTMKRMASSVSKF